jgi:hypothetical protein
MRQNNSIIITSFRPKECLLDQPIGLLAYPVLTGLPVMLGQWPLMVKTLRGITVAATASEFHGASL